MVDEPKSAVGDTTAKGDVVKTNDPNPDVQAAPHAQISDRQPPIGRTPPAATGKPVDVPPQIAERQGPGVELPLAGKKPGLTAKEATPLSLQLTDDDLLDNGYSLTRELIDDNANKQRYFIYTIGGGMMTAPADAPHGNNYVKGGRYTAAVICSYKSKPYVYAWASSADEVRQLALSAKSSNLTVLGIARLQ